MHPLILIAGSLGFVAAIDKLLSSLLREPKVFVSYYYDKDKSLKRLLNAWSKNTKFEIQFEDMSADVSLQTVSDEDLSLQLTKRIESADVVLVLIGNHTHLRKWVRYEIKEAVRLSKPIIAVKQKRAHASPQELKNVGAHWIYGFKADKISSALKETVF